MAITLCIETSGPHCSLALAHGEQLYTRDEVLERSHNQHFLRLMDELFTQAQCRPVDVEVVAFGCGPGSFTGVRIAAAAVQAVALAADARIVTIPSSVALALSAHRKYPEHARFICAVKSRAQAYYLSSHLASNGFATEALLNQEHADELTDQPPPWLEGLGEGLGDDMPTLVIGGCPPWLPENLVRLHVEGLYPQAADFVDWARRQHERGRSQAAEAALPLYISGDSPWKKSDRQ